MNSRLLGRVNAALDRHLPEQRLFLKSEEGTRFIRLRPITQASMILGSAVAVGWTVIVTSFFLIDSISSGSARDLAEREQETYQVRLNQLALERDARAAEASAAQDRFALAMDQVSAMQTQLLDSEERSRELEIAVDVIQSTLRRTIQERDEARVAQAALQSELQADTGTVQTAAERERELEQTLAFLNQALELTAQERDTGYTLVAEAEEEINRLHFQAALDGERSERVFRQLEEAVAVSMEPLDEMFRAAGMNTDDLIDSVRRGYSGQGGPLTPILSTSGEPADELSERANEVLGSLDRINMYRIAAERLPFANPVNGSYRNTSGFGPRGDPFNGSRRMHNGVDFAGARGTQIVAGGAGVVTHAGRMSGYGNAIEITHANGFMTRYAHMSRLRVSEGQRVSPGDHIGDMGCTGRCTGTHLHYEVHRNGTPVNPMTFIRAGRNVF
ncbi:M23 family metallopeptidase [Gymnodinialimonas ceratoperidinii]|uniref:Peptidoglycan DD-metalloendopeptidase family protein n=1 Tax=Gymnodinialimonas ceratoperidinii TaxID=2856823 RepID=A0A8F6TTA4_9RHOB|nr:M23 family metallopeptidase [Gymnodinialimonas ceratoperidinii]QXT38547.1 peptidoglycan DD-metalloendopeptidase family protein [Gymnodinialimonas ceratoperidinii]